MVDLNLLPALDALLREQSVTAAAQRLSVSTPAMSRTLARLRRATGDPLLVPAGRGLTATPAALAMLPAVEAALAAARAALGPAEPVDPADLRRRFTIRCGDVVAALLSPGLVTTAARDAPGVTLRFAAEGDEDPADLRDAVDLDVSAPAPHPPDVVVEHVLSEPLVGLVHVDHPPVTGLESFAATPQVAVSRRGLVHGPVDDLLAAEGLTRTVALTVASHTVAAWAVLGGDLLAVVPRSFAARAAATGPLRTVELPVALPPLHVAMAWHRRLDADGGHRWLRGVVREALLAATNRATAPG